MIVHYERVPLHHEERKASFKVPNDEDAARGQLEPRSFALMREMPRGHANENERRENG